MYIRVCLVLVRSEQLFCYIQNEKNELFTLRKRGIAPNFYVAVQLLKGVLNSYVKVSVTVKFILFKRINVLCNIEIAFMNYKAVRW